MEATKNSLFASFITAIIMLRGTFVKFKRETLVNEIHAIMYGALCHY